MNLSLSNGAFLLEDPALTVGLGIVFALIAISGVIRALSNQGVSQRPATAGEPERGGETLRNSSIGRWIDLKDD